MKEQVMRKPIPSTKEERKLKFAEAGVLFVLVLALTVFIGTRMAKDGGPNELVEVAQVAEDQTNESPVETTVVTAPEFEEVATTEVVVEETLAAQPPRIVTYIQAEQTYFDGNYTEAADMFSAYTTEHAENAWGFYMLGLSQWKAGELDAAEDAFAAALEIKPDHVKSLINSSRVLLALDRPDEARAQVALALAVSPENIDANRMYSRISHSKGELEEAAIGYLNLLQIKNDDTWALNNLGLIRIEQGRYEEAVAPLAKAAQLDSQIACIQNNLGVALERNGHYTAAAIAFEMALSADENYAKADESLARVSELTESSELVAIDLVIVAENFDAGARMPAVEAPSDMEVAAFTTADIESEELEIDQPE
ncbi:MAG: tetratricopeptide (TPR) repeat protein [Candidatus Krumholzibacteriia bacterium]|jgi:tetratricopeptide (TPR) repeat protein